MSNTCVTENIFSVMNAEDVPMLEKFRSYLFEVAQSVDRMKETPLCRMLLDKGESVDFTKVNVRDDFAPSDIGDIEPYGNGAKFTLQEGTAWRPCDAAWGIVLKHFPGINLSYVGYEPANRVFKKHDPDNLFQNRLHIVFTEVEPDAVVPYGMELGNDDELLNFLKETFKLTGDYTVKDLSEVQDMCKKLAEQMGTYLEITSYDIV